MSTKRNDVQNHNRNYCCLLSICYRRQFKHHTDSSMTKTPRQPLVELFKVDIHTKKRGSQSCYSSHCVQALALPCQSKRATSKAPRHVYLTNISARHTKYHEPTKVYNTPDWGVPVAQFLTNSFEFARFIHSQNQSVQVRLICIYVLYPPSDTKIFQQV